MLCEFLEVAFHLVLYVREVYPAVVFERRKKYNVPVQVSEDFRLEMFLQRYLHELQHDILWENIRAKLQHMCYV